MKFEDVKKFLDMAKMGLDAVVSISDWRARRRTERRKALDDEKDRRIKELEKELAALKGTKNVVATTTAASTEPAGELHPEGDLDDAEDGDADEDADADEE